MAINDFIAQVKEGGLARTNRYIVDFRPPVAGEDDTKRKLILFCDQVQLPGQNFSTVQNRTFGEFREVPYERIYDNITLSFLVDSGMNVKKVFDKWMDKIADPNTRTYGYYKDYTVDMTIEVQDVLDKKATLTVEQVAMFDKEQLPTAYTSFGGFEIHNLYEFFMVFVVLCGIAAIILAVLTPKLKKMMHGVR
jgi:hypothetical protein